MSYPVGSTSPYMPSPYPMAGYPGQPPVGMPAPPVFGMDSYRSWPAVAAPPQVQPRPQSGFQRFVSWLLELFRGKEPRHASAPRPSQAPIQPHLSDEAFVTDLYARVLGRQPDLEGYQAHLNGLRQGTSRQELLQVFLNSDEYRQRQASPVVPSVAPQPVAPPMIALPAAPSAPLEGFDLGKLNNPNHRTPKYLFARVVQHVPLASVRDHAGADALLRSLRPQFEAAGLRILDVKNDKIHVVTEIGAEWVDVIRGAGSGNPAWWWGSEGVPSAAAQPSPLPAPPPPAGQPAPVALPPPQAPGPLTPEEVTLANSVGIVPDRTNLRVYIEEMQGVHDQNALGPGVQQPKYVSELQQRLAAWGYNVQVNGQFDQATTEAVLQFKRDFGAPFTRAGWRYADGSLGIHPFVDEATKAAFLFRLEQERGPAFVGHVDELGILRPSNEWKAMLGLHHSWVYNQPFRDNAYHPSLDQAYAAAKLQSGRYVSYTLPNGRIIPLYRR